MVPAFPPTASQSWVDATFVPPNRPGERPMVVLGTGADVPDAEISVLVASDGRVSFKSGTWSAAALVVGGLDAAKRLRDACAGHDAITILVDAGSGTNPFQDPSALRRGKLAFGMATG